MPWIDCIRFLAAFEVFLFHLRPFVFRPYDAFVPAHQNIAVIFWFTATHFGGDAVLIFFALSGYLVGGGLIERVRAGTFQPGAYAIDRSTRLLLPFAPALLCAVILQVAQRQPIDILGVLGNLASLQGVFVPLQPNLGVDWSLAYEFWFYVLGGTLAAFFVLPSHRMSAVALAAAALFIFSVLDASLLFCWIIGALFSQIQVRRASRASIIGGLALGGSSLFLSNEVFAVVRAHVPNLNLIPESLMHITLTIGLLIVLCNVVAIPCSTPLLQRINDTGKKLASFSYSLYLVHVPALTALALIGFPQGSDLTVASIAQYVASILIVLVTAYLFYWMFERHTDSVRRWLKRALLIQPRADRVPKPQTVPADAQRLSDMTPTRRQLR